MIDAKPYIIGSIISNPIIIFPCSQCKSDFRILSIICLHPNQLDYEFVELTEAMLRPDCQFEGIIIISRIKSRKISQLILLTRYACVANTFVSFSSFPQYCGCNCCQASYIQCVPATSDESISFCMWVLYWRTFVTTHCCFNELNIYNSSHVLNHFNISLSYLICMLNKVLILPIPSNTNTPPEWIKTLWNAGSNSSSTDSSVRIPCLCDCACLYARCVYISLSVECNFIRIQ